MAGGDDEEGAQSTLQRALIEAEVAHSEQSPGRRTPGETLSGIGTPVFAEPIAESFSEGVYCAGDVGEDVEDGLRLDGGGALTYLPTYLLTHLLTYLLTYFLTSIRSSRTVGLR